MGLCQCSVPWKGAEIWSRPSVPPFLNVWAAPGRPDVTNVSFLSDTELPDELCWAEGAANACLPDELAARGILARKLLGHLLKQAFVWPSVQNIVRGTCLDQSAVDQSFGPGCWWDVGKE